MYYLIGRDLDADGNYEFVKDMDNMILTDDANSALQMTEKQLDYIDMEYLNEAGFYALEADRFRVSILEALLFTPLVRGYRPRVAPPPRRRRPVMVPPPPPPHRPHRPAHRRNRAITALNIIDAILDPGPAPRRRKPRPRVAAPRPRAVVPARPAAVRAPARPGLPSRPVIPKAPTRHPKPARPGGRGPAGGRGGRGPGR